MFDLTLETVNGDDINWQELVFQEITTSPQLQVNETYQAFFERAQRELLKPIAELTDKNKCLQSGSYANFLPINALMLVSYNCEVLLKKLLDNFKVNINLTGDNVIYSDRHDASPLHYAAQRGKLLYIKWLLERGADIYERTSSSITAKDYYIQPGFNALAYAAKEGHAEIMQVLLDHDAKIGKGDLYTRSSNPYSCMPLHLAAGSGSTRAVTLLFEHGASKDIQSEYKGETPLYYACEKGCPEVIKYLLENGAIYSLSKTNLNNYTPLHIAAKNGHFDAVKLLLQWGAKINFITGSRNRSDTVLGCAFLSGNKQLILFLIENGADVSAPNLNNQKPLHMASKFGDLDILLALLEKGAKADIYKMTPNKELPAHFAAEAGKADAVALLLAQGTNINVTNSNGLTLLHLAARSGDTKTCELLMRRGLKEYLNTSVGLFGTPLQCAIKANQYATVEFFLQQGASVDVTTSYDKTCLHLAVEVENIQILELLLKTEARKYINTKTKEYLYEEMTPLHIAIKKHLLDHIKLLLAQGADVCILAKHNSTCLQLALENTSYSYNQPENTEEIIRLLWMKSTEADKRQVDSLGQNLLHLAAKRYDIKSMLFLLNHGLDDLLMQKNFEQRTPLEVLEKNEGSSLIIKFMNQFDLKLQDLRTQATEKLIDKFIDILQLQFYEAINRDRLDQAKSILEQLPKEVSKEIIHKRDKQGQTPLFIASKNGSTKVVRFLLSLDIDINQYCYDGSYYSSAFSYVTPLAASIVNNKEEILKLLISAGAIIDNAYLDATELYKIEEFSESLRKSIIPEGTKIEADTNIYQTVPLLHLAAKMGHVVIMELLLKEAAININGIDQSGFSALQCAIKNEKVEAVKSLIAHKANVDLASSKDSLPMILAIKNTQILKILLEAGAEINHANEKGLTPIFYAIKSKCTESVQLLLQYKAEINQFSAERKTPLMVAVKKSNLAVLKLLLEAGAQVNAVDSKGHTALFYAIKSREIKKVKLLLDYKSDVNHISTKPDSLTSEEGRESHHEIFLETDMTPLMLAAAKGDCEILQLLLKYHADLKQLTAANASPLMFAVYNGHIKATSLLIKQGCPINQMSLKGDSALLIAVSRGRIEIVKLLLDKNADPNLADVQSRTPLFTAMTKLPNLEIIRMLIEAGAQIKIPEGLSGYDFNDAIYTMVKENDLELLKFLMGKGITIKERISAHKDKNFIRSYSRRKSLVLMATENNAYEMVELLIKLGCEVNEIYAAYKDDTEVTKKIYKTRQHYHYRNQSYYDQETNEYYPESGSEEEEEEETITIKGDHYTLTLAPIHVAIQSNNLKLVQLLITAGANVNQSITTDNNVFPLHLAFNLTYFDIAETLITNGADVNQACSASRYPRKYKGAPSSLTIAFSPLLLAAVNDKNELVEYLILKEAYLALPPKKTLTPPSWDLISFPLRDSFSSIKRDEVKKTKTLEEILERRLNCSIEVFESAPTSFQVLVLMSLAHESFVSKHQKLADECLRKAVILNPDKLIKFFEYLLQGKLISKCSERELTFLIDTILQMTKSNKSHYKKVSFIIASHIMSSDYSDLREKLLTSLMYSIMAGDYPGATTLKIQAFNLLLNQKGLPSSMSQLGVTLDNFENFRKIIEGIFAIKEDKDSLTFPIGCLDRFGLFGDSIRQLKKLPSTDIFPSQDDTLITKTTLPQRRNSI